MTDGLFEELMKQAKTTKEICDMYHHPNCIVSENVDWLPVSAVTDAWREVHDIDKIVRAVEVALYERGLLKEVPSHYESVIYNAVKKALEVKL